MIDHLLVNPDFASSSVAATLRDAPLGFVDVGARGGVHEVVEPLAGLTAVLGFEPDREECDRLRSELGRGSPWARYEIEPYALSAMETEATLHLLEAPTNHSLRGPNRAFTERYGMTKFVEVGRSTLQTRTLDSILFGRRAKEPVWGEFLKLDTQGTELEILRGAERTVRERTVAVLSEVSFCEIYSGQALFSEVELWMRERGFSFYGFTSFHARSRKLLDKRTESGRERALYADAAFLRDPLAGSSVHLKLSPRALQVLFSCALLLGYLDFALELARETFAPEEASLLERVVRREADSPPEVAFEAALELAERVRRSPERASVEVGRFVDGRRQSCDYDDVPD